MQEMPDMTGEGRSVLYPKMVRTRCLENNEFLDMAADSSSLSRGDLEAALHAVARKMREFLALGYSVKVDELGTFSARLRMAKGKERERLGEEEEHRNAQSIVVGKVGFLPSRRLVRDVHGVCRLERDGEARRLRRSPYTLEERVALAREFLQANAYMTVADYARMTKVPRSSASAELRRLREDEVSGITTRGRAPHMVYVMGG
jgi:predicted histone-like DNA-binding protein